MDTLARSLSLTLAWCVCVCVCVSKKIYTWRQERIEAPRAPPSALSAITLAGGQFTPFFFLTVFIYFISFFEERQGGGGGISPSFNFPVGKIPQIGVRFPLLF